MFSLILIVYKLNEYYICPLGKSVMCILKFSIMFNTLGVLAAENGSFVGIPLDFSANISSF